MNDLNKQCNKCKYYNGVHDCPGNAPCKLRNTLVMHNFTCNDFKKVTEKNKEMIFNAKTAKELANAYNDKDGGYDKFFNEIISNLHALSSNGEYGVHFTFDNKKIGYRRRLANDLINLGFEIEYDRKEMGMDVNWRD